MKDKTFNKEKDDELIGNLKDIINRLEKVESYFHIHKNIKILNKLDPNYFKSNAEQIESLIAFINKLIQISHFHKNIELLNKIDNENIINKFAMEEGKLTFEGKEIYFKKKSFFKSLFNR